MQTKPPPRDLKTLWRDQATEDHSVTLENIHTRADSFQRQIRRRNVRETVAAAFVIVVFGWYAWIFPGWMIKTGSILSMFAAAFVVWELRKRAAGTALPDTFGTALVEFHRRELVRQRDALKSVGTWYIAPFIPGASLMSLGRYYQFHVAGRTIAWDHRVIILGSIIVALLFAIVWVLNAWGAKRLQRKIDELDKLQST